MINVSGTAAVTLLSALTFVNVLDRKMAWYAADVGGEILREIIEALEGARDGQPICPGMTPASS